MHFSSEEKDSGWRKISFYNDVDCLFPTTIYVRTHPECASILLQHSYIETRSVGWPGLIQNLSLNWGLSGSCLVLGHQSGGEALKHQAWGSVCLSDDPNFASYYTHHRFPSFLRVNQDCFCPRILYIRNGHPQPSGNFHFPVIPAAVTMYLRSFKCQLSNLLDAQ